MLRLILTVFMAGLIFSSCEISVTTNKEKEAASSKIRNGIVIKSNGIKVEQAFLQFEDGALVLDDNKIAVNQKIKIRLIVSGWKEKDGKVFLNAAEKMETSEGDVFLDEKDLFSAYTEGLSPEDAQGLSLSVIITQLSKLYDFFKVSFRVDDKTDPNNFVEGYYKLYLH